MFNGSPTAMIVLSRTIPSALRRPVYAACRRRLDAATASFWTVHVKGAETATVSVLTWREVERAVEWELDEIIRETTQ